MRRFAGIATTLFACVNGCGSDEHFIDAGDGIDTTPIDGSVGPPDAEPDAEPPTVEVQTYALDFSGEAPGTPAAGVAVIVIQPDGSAGTGGVTDASGHLVLTGVEAGASVTAVYEDGTRTRLKTTTTVEPGDVLTFGDHYFSAPITGGADGTMTVTFPNGVANAVRVRALHPCATNTVNDGTATTLTLDLTASCQTPTADILLYVENASFEVIAAGFLDGAAYTPGSTATLAAWTPITPDNFTVSVTGIPDDAPGVATQAYAHYGQLGDFGNFNLFPNSAGTSSLTFTNPGFADRTWTANELLLTGTVGDVATFRTGAADATAATLTTPGVPRVGQLSVNASLGAASWLQGTGTYDGALLRMQWNYNESFYEDSWDVLFPPGVTAFAWTGIPAALEAYVPATTKGLDGRLMLLDLGSADGYDDLRGVASWEVACPSCAIAEGDEAAIDVAFDYGGGEGPMSFFQRRVGPPVVRPDRAIDLRQAP